MTGAPKPIGPGLYFVSTPIGAARDITLRALDILAGADVLVAEDTRSLRHLMEIHGLKPGERPLWAYHDHNGERMRPRILAALAAGRSVAYASEAGTPLVADPGFQLGRAAIAAGHPVLAAPGASALLAALTVSGLPTDRFLFAGFPPPAVAARRRWLKELAAVPATLILYESPKRIQGLLADLVPIFGETRQAALCRELTKRFEEVTRASLGALLRGLDAGPPRGEIVLVVDRAPPAVPAATEIESALREAMATMSIRDAAAVVAEAMGLSKRAAYQAALKLEGEQ